MDREKWLAMRNTPRKTNREKMIHVSTNMGRVKNEDEPNKIKTIKLGAGKTFKRAHNRGD